MIKYLVRPYYITSISNVSLKEKVIYLLKSYWAFFMFVLLSFFIIKITDSCIVNILHLPSIYTEIHKNNISFTTDYGNYAFLIIVLVVPFIEELIFRLPLDLKKRSIGIAFSILIFRFSGNSLLGFDISNSYDLLRLFSAINVYILIKKYFPEKWLDTFKGENFKYVFYTLSVIFALVHISNFSTSDMRLWVFYPIYVLPQFFMALIMSNIRMQYGLMWSFLLHALINLPSILF